MAKKETPAATVYSNLFDSKYRKILIAAKRSKQIQKGAHPRIDIPGAKPTRVAIEEVNRGLVSFETLPLREKT